jgi:hypothetical protein
VGIGKGAGKAGGRAAGGQVRKGRRPEEGDGADGWAPSVGERERGGKGAGAVGPKGLVGRGLGWVVSFFFLFFSFLFFSSFSFQILFKPISNLLNSNLLHVFKFKF